MSRNEPIFIDARPMMNDTQVAKYDMDGTRSFLTGLVCAAIFSGASVTAIIVVGFRIFQ